MAESGVTVRTNLPDFLRQLADFKGKLQTTIVRKAMSAAAEVFKNAVIAAAPRLKKYRKGATPGLLARSIYVFKLRANNPGRMNYVVSFKKKDAKSDPYYGRWLETGWMPRGPGKSLKGGVRTRRLQRERSRAAGHRFVRYPFLQPAFDRAHAAALMAFQSTMQLEIDKANKRKR